MARHPIVAEDCAKALQRTECLWDHVQGKRIFVTGGSGFFGTWFLELLTSAVDKFELDVQVIVLTRDPIAYRAGTAGHVANHPSVQLWCGDVRNFTFPSGKFDLVAHFGSTGSKAWHDNAPAAFEEMVVAGTKRVYEFAAMTGVRRVLLASSGAVYGPALPHFRIPETYFLPKSENLSANARSKLAAENIALDFSKRYGGPQTSVARGFAFIGPYLPTGAGFAAHDFLQAAASGRPVVVSGDGTPIRSYLYGSDLATWLWTLLIKARGTGVWNVGSEAPKTICELARYIALKAGVAHQILRPSKASAVASWYVPCTQSARDEYGVIESTSFNEATDRSLKWYSDIRKTFS
jgi:dTDP-glucose 4,6-dehydratase